MDTEVKALLLTSKQCNLKESLFIESSLLSEDI